MQSGSLDTHGKANREKPSAQPVSSEIDQQIGEQVVTLRREVLPEQDWSSNRDALITADAFARRGRFLAASEAYSAVVRREPQDAEAWLALGNALVNHADGNFTPPAAKAYRVAQELDPDTPGVPFFVGLAMIEQGNFIEAREAWVESLSRTSPDSDAHALLKERLGRLDGLLQAVAEDLQSNEPPAPSPSRP